MAEGNTHPQHTHTHTHTHTPWYYSMEPWNNTHTLRNALGRSCVMERKTNWFQAEACTHNLTTFPSGEYQT